MRALYDVDRAAKRNCGKAGGGVHDRNGDIVLTNLFS